MLYRHVFDNIFTKFRRIFRVFGEFRGFTRISRLRDSAKYQKPWLKKFQSQKGRKLGRKCDQYSCNVKPCYIGCLCKSSQQVVSTRFN